MCSSSKGHVWWWIAALSVLVEILVFTAAQVNVPSALERNVALNRPCNQTSSVDTIKGQCEMALDGREGNYNDTNSDCLHTAFDTQDSLFSVNIGPNIYIHKIIIKGRTGYRYRMSNMYVYLDNRYLIRFKNNDTNHTHIFRSHEVKKAEIVSLKRFRNMWDDESSLLNICEVYVYACVSDRYGLNCEKTCDSKCVRLNVTCDRLTGACLECQTNTVWGGICEKPCPEGCKPGNVICNRTTGACIECPDGKWGNNCTDACGAGCEVTNCHLNGTCKSHCRSHWMPPKCDVCNPGKWGDDCLNDCGEGCKGGVCNKANGHCNCTTTEMKPPMCGGCNPGKWGKNCTEDCGAGCEGETCKRADGSCECQPGWVGTKCDANLKSGISILLDGKEIFVTDDETADPAYIPNNRRRNWTGQVLKLQRKGPRVDPLMICEVEVFNCLPGFFGYECEGICEKPVCDNARFCSRIDGSCPETDEVKETSDCSPLILVAGYVVGFLIISLFIFAAKVIPYEKKSKPKAVKKEAEGDKEEEKTEGEGSGSGGDKVEESQNESGSGTDEKESEV